MSNAQRIVIIGGGSAGWLAALAFHNKYPDQQIKVIASEEIGILGAGEGTTPFFVKFLERIGISAADIIKNCAGTAKLGIDFKAWRGDGKDYFHSFEDIDTLDYSNENKTTYSGLSYVLAKSKKVPVVLEEGHPRTVSTWALHFDANLLAKYLKAVALERGVIYVDAKVSSLETTKDGEIAAVRLVSGDAIDVDFLVDCSGFARLALGETYKTRWLSYENKLPVDTAIPFFIPHNNDVPPVTEAIAMKYGWVWKIPVRDRYGCGYVFDSSYINKAEALKEAEEYFGMALTSPKTFTFSPGRYRHTLVKNCLAVGLAQSFIEPLEATSLWVTCTVLTCFLHHDGLHKWGNSSVNKEVNRVYESKMDDIVSFVHLHYITDRKDSIFWRNFSTCHPITKEQTKTIKDLTDNVVASSILNSAFTEGSWLSVACGLGLLPFRRKVYSPQGVDKCMTHAKLVDICEGIE